MQTNDNIVKIYTEDVHPAISYTLDVISTISGWPMEWIDELPEDPGDEIIVAYSKEPVEGLPLMKRSGFWENMTDFPTEEVSNGPLKGLFPVYKGIMSIDLFAFVFWSVSRVEEYSAYESDKYGRFPATSSWAYKNDMLYRPYVDEWVHLWQLKMISVFPKLNIPKREILNRPTFDFDYPYLFKHQSWQRIFKRLAGALVRGQWGIFSEFLKGEDPFDTFDEIIASMQRYKHKPYFFFLANNNSIREDRTMPLEHAAYQKVIKRFNDIGELGIHPSILSHDIPGQLQEELGRLENIVCEKIQHSRSHFLKLQVPETYRKLLDAGIMIDHSMGFADRPGFRAGTAYPFFWYDLSKNRPTALRVHPLLIMDATFKYYLKCSPQQALKRIEKIYEKMSTTGGEFTWLWHNTSFSRSHGWKNWRKVYQMLLKF